MPTNETKAKLTTPAMRAAILAPVPSGPLVNPNSSHAEAIIIAGPIITAAPDRIISTFVVAQKRTTVNRARDDPRLHTYAGYNAGDMRARFERPRVNFLSIAVLIWSATVVIAVVGALGYLVFENKEPSPSCDELLDRALRASMPEKSALYSDYELLCE